MRWIAAACAVVTLSFAATAAAQTGTPGSWAAPQITAVVDAGLMAPSVDEFRADEPLTVSELATILASFGVQVPVSDPDRLVTLRELDAHVVRAAGLRPTARKLRLAALEAGLSPKPWLGTETVARLLGLRVNHSREREELELQLTQPATRAEVAYSVARLLALRKGDVEWVRETVESFSFPELTPLQQTILRRALRFVGSPYVWAGTSERPQQLFGRLMPGGFDCSGFVWRVYKVEPFAEAPELATVLKGRTSYDMSGEVAPALRLTREQLQPGDLVFFGNRGPRSRPNEVGHMGIYVGNGWMVHSSERGTTLTPMSGWYETRFAWGRSLVAEAGLDY